MTKNNYQFVMDLGRNKTSNNINSSMMREQPTTYYSISNIESKPINHEKLNFNKNEKELDETLNKYPITTPVNKVLDILLKNEQLGENVHNFINILQKKFLPQINKLEVLLLNNKTYLFIVKILGLSKESTIRAAGAIATITIFYVANTVLRKQKKLLLDIFTYLTPAISVTKMLMKEPELLGSNKNKDTNFGLSNKSDEEETVPFEYVKTHKFKTWLIYLIISSLFNITDNLFINKSKPVIESTITKTVITTTPYLLRDTGKDTVSTVSYVTPLSYRLLSYCGQKVKNTIKYSWYWVMKFGIIYWMGYRDGRETIYDKLVVPCIKKYCEFQLKSKRAFSEMDITFEDSDSFSKKYKYIPTNHQPRVSGNTRDQGLQPSLYNKTNENGFVYSNNGLNSGESSLKRFEDNPKKDDLKNKDFINNKNNDAPNSVKFCGSGESDETKLNSNNSIFNSRMKYGSNFNKKDQNTDLISDDEGSLKNNTFIISNNSPIKHNRSLSLNSINHSNDSLNNYKEIIYDTNNKLHDYYNDTSFDKDYY
ncbi:hypothetical protein H8356DRAFT_1081097 [Neocallimastix lanati (nom. inval.)]|jgi:hypothetical protein|uniref:Uncharacterized protein n=1 Tax=Neocallimastix californiae TaxID=1754190 RepID=A0A1Y2BZA3_9FUNG|nr:hypothetical protein H8356DRAFT_1081097 [Neocallimastix sp. JGI-2020a]ORY40056.1 hypothetical protein LY90DRAFT_672289 [Neocallimastix californiae]|eukprot:ORY40056.1 hypothetical protein LY90DRAFT_672289 [Neocallimastix californiae]